MVREPWDPSAPESERFPHVYGGPLPLTAVSRVEPILRQAAGPGAVAGEDFGENAPLDARRASADRTQY